MAIEVQKHGHVPGGLVTVTLTEKESHRLFHDVNRLLSLLDSVCPNLEVDGHPDRLDQDAYNRVNELLALLQRKLDIPQEQP